MPLIFMSCCLLDRKLHKDKIRASTLDITIHLF